MTSPVTATAIYGDMPVLIPMFRRPRHSQAEPSAEDREDAGLLLAVGQGDRDRALPELYRQYERRLYGFGLRLLGDRGLAEELVQEAFVRVWRNAGRFDPERGT